MNKKLVSILSGALIAGFAIVGPSFAADINVNDVKVESAEKPFIQDQRVMVPFRAIFEALGCEVKWDPTEKSVVAETKDHSKTLKLVIGEKNLSVNGEKKAIDVAPMIQKNHTFLPVRAISEALGYEVAWDGAKELVSVKEPKADAKKDLKDAKAALKEDAKALKNAVKEDIHNKVNTIVASHKANLSPEMRAELEKKVEYIREKKAQIYKARNELKEKRSLLHADFLKKYSEDRDAFRAYLQSGAPLLSVTASNFDLDIEDKREEYLEKKRQIDAVLKDLQTKLDALDAQRVEVQKALYQ